MTNSKLLLATDFSKKSFKIIKNVLKYIENKEDELFIIHVVEDKLFQEKIDIEIAKTEGFKLLKKKFPILKEEQFICVEGDLEEQIALYTEKLMISFTILGNSKKNDFIYSFFENSNTKDIVRNLKTLNLIIKSKDEISFKNILIPSDLSPESKKYIYEVSSAFPEAKIKIYYSYSLPYERGYNFNLNKKEISEYQKEIKKDLIKEAEDFFNSLEITNKKKLIIKESILDVKKLLKDSKDLKTDLLAIHTTGFFSFFAFYLVEYSKTNILIKKVN